VEEDCRKFIGVGNRSSRLTCSSFQQPIRCRMIYECKKMHLYADKESASKTKERVSTKTFKRKRKRQNQKHRMSPGTKTLGQFLLSLQSFKIYINMNSHLMHSSRFCRIICSRINIMSYSSPFLACLHKRRSKHLKEH
jgi:hypothetical protein